MDDRIEVLVALPLDDGFLRRQCPACNQQFKWFVHGEGDPDAEQVDQYFCPLCGTGASIDDWNTPAQTEYVLNAAGPTIDQYLQDSVAGAFKGIKGALEFKSNPSFSLDLPTPEPLNEPNDMVAIIPPCHPNEPIKVPGNRTSRIHCLICGQPFAA